MLIVVIMVLIAGAGFVTAATMSAERATREQVRSTTEILQHLRATFRGALEMETGQRGYLITENPTYLPPYTQGRITIQTELDALAEQLPEDQQERLATLRDLIGRKQTELEETIALVSDGRKDAALEIVESDLGKNLMTSIRIIVAELEAEEAALLEEAIARAEREEARAVVLLAIIALSVAALVILGLSLERRTVRAELAARDAEDLRVARERSDLLARELDHRVKNLFAIVLAIVNRSGDGGGSVKATLTKLRERIHALSVAHSVSTGQLERRVAMLSDLVDAALTPYRQDGDDVAIHGPEVALPASLITPMGLILHEMATNATKYGAFATEGARLQIEWNAPADGFVDLEWRETGVSITPEVEQAEGFGSLMMRSSARQLGGAIERTMEEDGITMTLRFRLTEG